MEVGIWAPKATRRESKPWGCLFGESMMYEKRRPRTNPKEHPQTEIDEACKGEGTDRKVGEQAWLVWLSWLEHLVP